jgi:Mg-chelatase subunit ChlI
VDTRPEVADACPDVCVQEACDAAVGEALEALRAQATTLDAARSILRLAGRMECRDDDGDLSVDALRAVGLRGTWSEGADEDASVEGTMTGARTTVAP